MANIDGNTWWQMTESRVNYDSAMYTFLGAGVYFGSFNSTGALYWQILNIGDDIYQIRNQVAGVNRQLGVCYSADELDASKTVPCMLNSVGDDSQKWNITEWGDGTYKIWNLGNGSAYNMDVHPGNPVFMSSNTAATPKQLGQHWMIKSLSAINDGAYSTTFTQAAASATAGVTASGVRPPVTFSTTSAAATTTGSSSNSNDSASQGLSTGASAGIGIGVALGVLLLVAIAIFFLLRKRRQRKNQVFAAMSGSNGYEQPGMSEVSSEPVRHEAYDHSASKAGKADYPHELGSSSAVAELPGSTWAGQDTMGTNGSLRQGY